MLLIRQAQMATMSKLVATHFEQRMVAHVQRFFPRQCDFIGRAQVDAAVELAIARAQSRGLHTCRQICLYLSLSFLLGSFFDEDPQYPWASHTRIGSNASADQRENIGDVFENAMAYLDAVHGEHNEHLIRALLRVRAMAKGQYPPVAPITDEASAQAFMVVCCPPKAARQPDATAGLLASATWLMKRQDWCDATDPAIVLVHSFLLGWGFERDPQFPWIAQALASGATASTMLRQSVDYINAVLR